MSRVLTGTVPAPSGLPMLVATDGSADRRRRRRTDDTYLTGFGWIDTAGGWGIGYCPQPAEIAGRDAAVVAELRAVWHAVHQVLPAGPVTVLLDSTHALTYLQGWAAGGQQIPAGYVGSAYHRPMVHRLAALVAAHPTHLDARWVKGHSGHLLNECADSLAQIGRRWLTEQLDDAAVRARAEWLVSGFLADHRLSREVA